MTDFSISGIWANAQISAADQARFFFRMDSLIPREFVGYARYLLSTIAGYESWGIPAVARGHAATPCSSRAAGAAPASASSSTRSAGSSAARAGSRWR